MLFIRAKKTLASTPLHCNPKIIYMICRLVVLCLLCFPPVMHAGILIESVNGDGDKGKVMIDGMRARIDSGDLGGYMLVNLESGQIYAVDHSERVIMELTPEKPSDKAHPGLKHGKPPQIKLTDAGKGPDILGYATQRYRVSINGLHCFDEYLSAQLLEHAELKHFVETLARATRAESNTAIGMPFDASAPCESANELVDDYYPRYGIPLRTVDSNGLVSHEVKRIDTNAEFLPGTFIVPPNYESVTREEMARRLASPSPGIDNDMSEEDIRKLRKQIETQMKKLQPQKQEQKAAPDQEP